MKMNLTRIKNDSNHIYEQLSQDIKYLFREIQEISQLDDTSLCLAICQLVSDGRIYRQQENDRVYYWVTSKDGV